MIQVNVCPDARQLAEILSGRAAAADVETFARHLEACLPCAEAADRQLRGDTLLEAMGAQPTLSDLPDDPAVQVLVERLLPMRSALSRNDPTPPPEPRDTAAEPGSPAPEAGDADDLGFLDPPQSPAEIGRLGSYRVLKLLGAGGMGLVFQAEDVALKRQVALKVMKPAAVRKPRARERFLREAQAAATLEHENTVAIFQVGEARGVPFLAMQLLRGMSLEDRLRKSGPLNAAQVLRLGRQIARGLAAAHERGLIHRDIKPANLWVEPEQGGRIKILDFGLARALADDVHLTQSGTIVGTPAYMAPEQAAGATTDARCDLFSLGVVLYRLCTGELPFRGNNTMAILSALAAHTPRPVRELNPTLPPELADLIMQLLSRNPADRPASARQVADRLLALERHAAAQAHGASQTVELPAESAAPKRTPEAAGPVRSLPAVAPRRRVPLAAALALVVLAPLTYFFGGTVIRFAMNRGELVVQVDDPTVEVSVRQNDLLVRDKTSKREFVVAAGAGEVEVFEKDGIQLATRKFTLTRGGKTTVTITLNELAAARKNTKPDASPGIESGNDRKAALWALSLGGTVTIDDGAPREISVPRDLPTGRWALRGIDLRGRQRVNDGLKNLRGLKNLQNLCLLNTQVTDADLKELVGLKNLQNLDLDGTRVTDEGMKVLTRLKNLHTLGLGPKITDAGLKELASLTSLNTLLLSHTQVTDAGLKELAGLKNIQQLILNTRVTDAGMKELAGLKNLLSLYIQGNTQVTDAGLKELAVLKNLGTLRLEGTRVTDVGLKGLAGLKNLGALSLGGTQVTDAGLKDVARLKNLQQLFLHGTAVTDAGLKELAGLKSLQFLDLRVTQVTDAGLKHLAGLKNLHWLELYGTKVSDESLVQLANTPLTRLDIRGTRISAKGFTALQAALPGCQIDWSEPNRTAAEAVLALGGAVHIRVQGRPDEQLVKAARELPAGYFRLTRVILPDGKKPLGDLFPKLAALTDATFDDLRVLDLSGTAIGGADLETLKPLVNLTELVLARTPIDGGLTLLNRRDKLRRLVLDGTPVTNAGLAELNAVPALEELSLARTRIDETGLASLKMHKKLRRLVLDGCAFRGAWLGPLKELPALTELHLGCLTLTDQSGSSLGELTKLERLSLAGSGIGDAGLVYLHGLTNLKELDVSKTKSTAAGVAALRKALPRCKITANAVTP